MSLHDATAPARLTLAQRIRSFGWGLLVLLSLVAGTGFLILYSAANGSLSPWANAQMIRFAIGTALMIVIGLTDLKLWLKLAYPLYGLAFVLLVAVEIMGDIGMGAQRWIDLGFFQIQPSEVMKIAIVLALARYFHGRTAEDIRRPVTLLPPLVMVLLPALLVLRQPDLGTTGMLVLGAGAIFFAAGVRAWKFIVVLALFGAMVPVGWTMLHQYQRERVMTFMDPSRDPLGAGYHITQSKIALGSGGVTGKGFMQGTQSHLSFLPEKQTDFIFTMYAEEFGLIGGIALLILFISVVMYALSVSLRARTVFGRLVAVGVGSTFFLYYFINIAMVMGLIPVVGVPLPLVSYGGTAMLTLMIAFGLLACVNTHRDVQLRRQPGLEGY
ncbi:rod shape-determining protein RodA [Tistrella bauzanensis]|uniref:Peptidoglycan glycosyltransferase MrdB n=1 Tax=Tistrella bauzanensis TaxID=657419 RepID=A0ABQ1IG65_9PROT|nr:rod shape-determining protein RodA [Tistrella bauzanensis]GGB37630.1 rod shape-determining protein RodA [Tistrella bauzanensis]